MFALTRHFRKALQPLANAALALNESERRAWLLELRADCPILARELERLLEAPLATAQHAANGPAAALTCAVVPGSPEYFGLRY